MKRRPKPSCKDIAHTIVNQLSKKGIEAYIWHGNYYKASHYIRFQDARMGSIRIADHEGKGYLKYRWNVRMDFTKCQVIEGRYFYPPTSVGKLLQDLRTFHRHRLTTMAPAKYNIPWFKQPQYLNLSPREELQLVLFNNPIQSLQDYTP